MSPDKFNMPETIEVKEYHGQELLDRLFKYYYLVRVPYLATKTIEEIKLLGVPKSGNKHIDNSKSGELVTTYITVEQMVGLYKNNINLYIVKQGDSVDIYNTLKSHISNWYDFLKTSLNADQVPIEDLTIMDEFSKEVLKFIRQNNLHLLKKSQSSEFFDYFKSLQNYSVERMVVSVDATSLLHEEKEEVDQFQHNNNRTSFFREKLAYLKKLEEKDAGN